MTRWVQIAQHVDATPAGRSGHCAGVHNGRLIVFGGVSLDDQGDMTFLNDMWFFSFADAAWTQAVTKGNVPLGRAGACGVVWNDEMWIFGGFSGASGWFSDVFAVSLTTWVWRRVDMSGEEFSARDKMAVGVKDNRVFLAGGFGPAGIEPGDDGFGDGQTFSWFDSIYEINLSTSMCRKLGATLPLPICASAALVDGDLLHVFGGSTSIHKHLRSGRMVEVGLDEKGAVRENATPIEGRSWATMVKLGDERIVFGGKNTQDDVCGDTWVNGVQCTGDGPSARCSHTLSTRDTRAALLFGGQGDDGTFFNDLWLLIVD